MPTSLTVDHIRSTWRTFNKRYFENRLKVPKEVVIVPAGQQGSILSCSQWGAYAEANDDGDLLEIRSLAQDIDGQFFNSILLHEMLHSEIGTKHDHRSKKYRQARLRLAREHPEILKELI